MTQTSKKTLMIRFKITYGQPVKYQISLQYIVVECFANCVSINGNIISSDFNVWSYIVVYECRRNTEITINKIYGMDYKKV